MFVEEVEKLQLRLVSAQEQYSGLERQHNTLSQRLSEERQRVDTLERTVKAQDEELVQLNAKLAQFRDTKQHLEAAEQQLVHERERAKEAHGHVGRLSEDLDTSRNSTSAALSALAEREAEIQSLREVLDPMTNLIEAVKALKAAETVISREVKRLDTK